MKIGEMHRDPRIINLVDPTKIKQVVSVHDVRQLLVHKVIRSDYGLDTIFEDSKDDDQANQNPLEKLA